VADARFAKPLDEKLILDLVKEHEVLITIEEGARGGFGAFVLHMLAEKGALDHGLKIRTMTLPDIFQDQDSPYQMYETAKLNAKHITATVLDALGRETEAAKALAG
jgi:1-deoxy-D-xylulose-5-phosphate synthase